MSEERDAALIEAINAYVRNPASFATTDKRGKFPLGVTKLVNDGANFEVVPLTHACTMESHQQIAALLNALAAWWRAAQAEPAQ